MRHIATCTLFVLLACDHATGAESVSFRRDVVPVFTKLGCNAGACHGTPSGKNGFRLSLRGYDPVLDHGSLTREYAGRRIDRLNPASSLVIAKGSGGAAHEGGKRFDVGDTHYKILEQWVADGAIDDQTTSVEQLVITPTRMLLGGSTATVPLRIAAKFASGPVVDVTNLVRFSTTDDAVARVSAAGVVRKQNRGEATIVAEYMGVMGTVTVIVNEPSPNFHWSNPSPNNFIDTHIFAKLKELQIEPSGLCTDEEFVRRAHLDGIGRLPTPDRVQAFLTDRTPTKRAVLIDELLNRTEFADWWGQKWADRLGVNQRFVGKIGAGKYHGWIRQQMSSNVPEDVFVSSILTASGGNYSNPPAGFYRRLRDPMLRAEEVSQLFLGVRIGCAKCHNHPGERWTQDDYYGFAAFFTQMAYRDGPFFIQLYDKEETVLATRSGTLTHPRTGRSAEPKLLGAAKPVLGPSTDRRDVFAQWLTAPENPFFAKAAANRIWFHLFGRGLVDPVDDFRISNPASHPHLLDALAAEFIRSKFDRKQLIRTVMNSRTYQLSSATTPLNSDDGRFHSHATVRRLGAEQLLDAIADACGVPPKFPGLPLGVSAVSLPDGEYKHPFLEAFGRPARAMACECEREADTTLSQALHLSGGKSFESMIRHKEGRAAKLVASQKTDSEIVEALFLATLSRIPTAIEQETVLKRLTATTSDNRRVAFENLLHALLNHPEFVFQH